MITVIDGTALVRSTNKSVRTIDGVETVGMTMYTDIYLRQDGAWKCVQAQITPVAPANYRPTTPSCAGTSRAKRSPDKRLPQRRTAKPDLRVIGGRHGLGGIEHALVVDVSGGRRA
jgi:hypothetical protein